MTDSKKKVLFLTKYKYTDSDTITSSTILCDYIKKQGHELYYVDPSEINIILNKDNVHVFYKDIDISDVDIIISRNTKNVVEKVDQVIRILKKKGAIVFGHEEGTPFCYRKFENHFKFIEYFPKTVYFTRNTKEEALRLLKQAEIDFPFIVKPEGSSKGIGVALVENKKDFDSYFDGEEIQEYSDFIMQEYLDILHEYRVFVLGKKSLGVCEKIADGIVKNFAQGGKFVYMRDPELEAFAEKLSLEIKHHVLGFDIVKTKDGRLKILEINSWPSFIGFEEASHINMSEKIFNYYLDCLKK
ncbi:MAG: ATP-grasp domain-containing protein [Candidatus Pacebacteria bacterium]|nr:ATP-grasp domain-containing protein [Candidatus Paceibacterota bacterium]MDD3919364.1 ATP-grasp domain-containing protein [Candidatus Paceibacterota bacterium]